MTRPYRNARPNAGTPGYCRRAYLLTELIGALPLIAVTSGLLTVGIAAVLGTQKRAAEVISGHHTISSLLDTVRRDTRAAVAAGALPTEDDADLFELQTPTGRIRYRFSGDQVTREATGGADRPNIPTQWRIPKATVTANLETHGLQPVGLPSVGSEPAPPDTERSAFSVLTIRIDWRGRSRKQVDPRRRFEADFFIGRGYRQ